jgi:hypothetical protein
MEANEKLIQRIQDVKENEVVLLAPNLMVWKEGSSFDIDITNEQFDVLENLLEEQKESIYYLIDLSIAKRPSPEMIKLVEVRLSRITSRFKHTAVFTGKNYMMYLAIKFYFVRFTFQSYSSHKSLKSALNSFI